MRGAVLIALVAMAPLACGGSSFVSAGDASTGDDGGGGGGPGDSGGGSDGGSTNPDAGGSTDAGPAPAPDAATCSDMEKELGVLRVKAETCTAGSNLVQCQVSVDDVCCPFTADLTNQAAIDEFKALLKAYETVCGPFACPAIACVKTPSGNCGALGVCK